MNRKQLAKEIDTLRTRLTRRLSNVEKRGLASELTNEARSLDLSVRGKSDKELRQLRRDLKRFLGRKSTSVRGSKEIEKVVDTVTKTISDYKDLSKYRQKRFNSIVNKAYELYPAFRDRKYRYKLKEYIMKEVQGHKSTKKILERLENIADEISTGEDTYKFEIADWSKLK